jgi:hypothetical protein
LDGRCTNRDQSAQKVGLDFDLVTRSVGTEYFEREMRPVPNKRNETHKRGNKCGRTVRSWQRVLEIFCHRVTTPAVTTKKESLIILPDCTARSFHSVWPFRPPCCSQGTADVFFNFWPRQFRVSEPEKWHFFDGIMSQFQHGHSTRLHGPVMTRKTVIRSPSGR